MVAPLAGLKLEGTGTTDVVKIQPVFPDTLVVLGPAYQIAPPVAAESFKESQSHVIMVPDDSDIVAAVPLEDEFMVITFPELPLQEMVPPKVVVVDAGRVIVFGALMVKLPKVLAPVKMTAPVPEPVMEIALNFMPPPANVLLVDDVSVIEMVDGSL